MRPHLLILGLILLIGLFFRSYKIVERFEFAHDGDLYSWIVKDITIDHHFRLLGQLTSAPGIFIGPLFYYLLIPFFLLFHMDPVGVILLSLTVSSLTIVSYYFVFSKLFKAEVGLIASFLYAILLSTVSHDRWVVPTLTTNLWVIWYFYAIVNIARGNYSILSLLGLLIGFIWHIHIALFPSLIAIPMAFLISRKLPEKKQILTFVIALFLTSFPLIIFETRHNFQQTYSLFHNLTAKSEGSGLYKFQLVLGMITKNINNLFFMPKSFEFTNNYFFVPLILLSALLLIKKKLLSLRELIPLYFWFFGVFFFFALSSSPISEYYFHNIEIIFLAIVSLFTYLLLKSARIGKFLVLIILGLALVRNGYYLINQDYYAKGYLERKNLVEYVSKDIIDKGYPCVGISYITAPGENVGFRYFFYLKKIHLVHPSKDVPVYNIVIPDELSSKEVKQKFGHIGIIPPTNIPPKETIEKTCQTPNTNLTDSMFGYVD